MYPIDNFLRHMTNPTAEGVFQLLVTDSGKCNFLGDKGCVLGDVKPLVCGIFPFMLYKLQLHYNYCCPGADNMECDCEIRESLGILLSQFLINSEKHKEDYGRELKEIQKKYQLPIENYQGCYTNQKQK
jgi:Fe-S-cluster containining protein